MDEYIDRDELLRYFRDESEELLRALEADLLRLDALAEGERPDSELVNAVFRALHTMKGSAGMLEIAAVAELAHRLETLCDLLRKERVALTDPLLELLFGGRDLLAALVDEALAGREGTVEFAVFLERIDRFAHGATIAESARLELGGPQPVRAAARAVTTVRVDVGRLDVLMDLVGELVINRTRIADLAAQLGKQPLSADTMPIVKELIEGAAFLSRTTDEMQEGIMKVRMVPIGGVFDRFPRLVRDLARTSAKEIELVVEGAATDLDKTIVDRIGEPLMHLVRNCVDHGIEMPEVRRERNKPPIAKIWLQASRIGNQMVVEVADDGGGIDIERVRARGIERGLISPSAQLTENELLDMIFVPGFSTAEKLSDVSGRGVGMDVVRRAIGEVGGIVEVDSVRNVGTRFTLKFPLTLAIVQALLVRSGDSLYAIPLDAIVDSHQIDPAQIFRERGRETIRVRERLLPLIRLREFFSNGDDVPDDPHGVMVVVVASAGRQFAIMVDEFRNDQEIVIKPLTEIVGRIAGISGATILANGSIALILDVASLVHAFVGETPGRAVAVHAGAARA